MLIMIGIVALLVIFAEPLTMIFYQNRSSEVYQMTVMGFRILPLCMPLSLISMHFSCFSQTSERKKLALVLPIVDGAVGVTVCSFILIPILKLNGLYVSNICNGVICFIIVLIASIIERKKFPTNLEGLMAIPAGIGVSEDDRIDITVRSIDDVVTVSQQVIDFCESKGFDSRRSYFAGLCLEEMTGNVVEHGFNTDNKPHSVDIRVIKKDDNLILRIRDNCKAFDPSERAKVMGVDQTGKNIGIQLVYKIAEKVEYQNLLGMNVLTIRI
jgi:anti-sigma regulatory factor (Ser/Thr protein kinase)